MGNKKTRRLLAKKIKELGLPYKLYSGNKRIAYNFLRAKHMQHILQTLDIIPGEIRHDCDGFNHPVKGVSYCCNHTWLNTFVFIDLAVEKTNGGIFCSCSCPEPARSREQIEKCMLEYLKEYKDSYNSTPEPSDMYEALINGKHICDERGIKYDKF